MKKPLKVLFLFDSPYYLPRGHDFTQEFKEDDWTTEDDVYKGLRENNYHISCLGLFNDIGILLEEIRENRPDVVFNMAEVFNQKSFLDKNVAAVLEMLRIPYTGASPMSLMICNNKELTKKILSFHRIRIPHFHTYYKNHRVWLPRRLKLPLIVKPLTDEGSRGIALASVVDSEEALIERVNFIHEKKNMHAIAEEYIDGREFYVSILGNKRLRVLPLREMKFGDLGEDEPRVATYKAKWDYEYREKRGIKNMFAGRLPEGVEKKIREICSRAYRALNMQCYARFDIRLTPEGKVYIIEANANPSLDTFDEVVQSAERAGIPYSRLLAKIITLAFQRNQ